MDKNNANAYQIRLEVLKLANDACFNLFYQKAESLKSKNIENSGSGIFKDGTPPEEIDKIYPTPEDILNRAEKLYTFICKKV